MAIPLGMAITVIRSTYALDVPSVKALEEIARFWKVSKSEALRRVIRLAAAQEPGRSSDGVAALEDLQKALALTPAKARAWAGRVRKERRSTGVRRKARGR
jgi:hypothetical protein